MVGGERRGGEEEGEGREKREEKEKHGMKYNGIALYRLISHIIRSCETVMTIYGLCYTN